MTEREDTIDRIERVLNLTHKDSLTITIPRLTAERAVSMLKEQEAVKPIKMQRMDNNFSFFVPYFLCGNCRYELEGKDVMFCAHCGRSVKWK